MAKEAGDNGKDENNVGTRGTDRVLSGRLKNTAFSPRLVHVEQKPLIYNFKFNKQIHKLAVEKQI